MAASTHHCFAFEFVSSTPDAARLTLGERPIETVLLNRAAAADAFGLVLTESTFTRGFPPRLIGREKEV
jgi:hypothetical protein